jgi:two-component system, OmpR family, KDP operon response regulator KdpE
VDFAAREAMVRGHGVHLTPKEFELLQHLANRLNKIVRHREILRTIWGPEYGDELDQLRTVVKQLRKKIEADPAEPQYLLTHSWVGYELREPKESAILPQYNITLSIKLQMFRSVA